MRQKNRQRSMTFAGLASALGGIPKIVFHGLRHTFATRCIEAGCDPKTVSSIPGHSNVALTLNLYVHPDIEAKRRATARMERALRLMSKAEEL